MGNVTKITGSHTMKFGIDMRRIHYIQQNSGNILYFTRADTVDAAACSTRRDTYRGDGYASFLLGGVERLVELPAVSVQPAVVLRAILPGRLEDQPQADLNLGLRWDYNGAPDEKYNRMNRGFNSTVASPIVSQIPAEMKALYPQLANLKGGFEFAGVNGNPRTVGNNDLNNWQPRVGAAYQLHQRLVLRGGYGLYSMNPNNNSLQYAGFQETTPLTNSLDDGRTLARSDLLSNPYPTGINYPTGSSAGYSTFVGRNNNWYNPNMRTPYVHQFSFGVQYQTTKQQHPGRFLRRQPHNRGQRRDGTSTSRRSTSASSATCRKAAARSSATRRSPIRSRASRRSAALRYFTPNTISQFDINRPFPQFNGNLLEQGRNDSKIWYNSLQVNYNLRLGRGLTLMSNYTWSKMMERWGFNDPYANVNAAGPLLQRPSAHLQVHHGLRTALRQRQEVRRQRPAAGSTRSSAAGSSPPTTTTAPASPTTCLAT